jgi:hypothetical protein
MVTKFINKAVKTAEGNYGIYTVVVVAGVAYVIGRKSAE